MKTIIAGSRNFNNYALFNVLIAETPWPFTEVVCGMAPGADSMGAVWAKNRGLLVKEFPADWERYGKAAGPIRNREMAVYADALVAFCFPGSRGTTNMVDQAIHLGKTYRVYYFSHPDNDGKFEIEQIETNYSMSIDILF